MRLNLTEVSIAKMWVEPSKSLVGVPFKLSRCPHLLREAVRYKQFPNLKGSNYNTLNPKNAYEFSPIDHLLFYFRDLSRILGIFANEDYCEKNETESNRADEIRK